MVDRLVLLLLFSLRFLNIYFVNKLFDSIFFFFFIYEYFFRGIFYFWGEEIAIFEWKIFSWTSREREREAEEERMESTIHSLYRVRGLIHTETHAHPFHCKRALPLQTV